MKNTYNQRHNDPRDTYEYRRNGEVTTFTHHARTWEEVTQNNYRLRDCALVAEMLGGESERSFRRCLETLASFATGREGCARRVLLSWDCELSFFWISQSREEDKDEWQNGLHGAMIFHPKYESTGKGLYDRKIVPGGEWSLHT